MLPIAVHPMICSTYELDAVPRQVGDHGKAEANDVPEPSGNHDERRRPVARVIAVEQGSDHRVVVGQVHGLKLRHEHDYRGDGHE